MLNVLTVRYRLDCSLRKHSIGYNIYIKEKSMPILRTLVQPYMHSSMLYKLRIDPNLKDTNQVNDSKFRGKLLNVLPEIKIIKSITRNKPEIRLNFQIALRSPASELGCSADQKSELLLNMVKEYLGGNIGYRKSQDTYYYGSTSFGSAKRVIEYFDHYHLQSRKHISYLRWRKVYRLIQNKEHLRDKGLSKILTIKSLINRHEENTTIQDKVLTKI